MTLREKLIVLRDKAGISQMTLAHQLGVSRQAVTRWESGDTTPSMDKLKALAKIYDVSLDWLCSDATDGKSLEEVVVPVEDNGTSNATTSAENKKKIRYAVIALVAGVIILTCSLCYCICFIYCYHTVSFSTGKRKGYSDYTFYGLLCYGERFVSYHFWLIFSFSRGV